MWETLSLPWRACLDEAWVAYCRGTVPIGSVITDADGHILARGRNRIQGHTPEAGYTRGHPLAHAELNALITLDYHSVDPHTCVLYSTTEPCPLCLGALYMSGVRELHYASRDPFAGSSNLLGATPYLSRKPVRAFGPENPALELLIMILYVDYALETYNGRSQVVFDAWQAVVPASVPLGRQVAASGVLRRMREARATVTQAVDYLAPLLTGTAL